MLSMVDQIKKDLKMDRWLHMPQTSYEQFSSNIVWRIRGTVLLLFWVPEVFGNKISMKHFQKAQTIFNLLGRKSRQKESKTKSPV